MLYLTEKAAKQIKFISEEEGIGHYTVRVKVLSGGCSGFRHDIGFDDRITETDEVYEMDGVKIVIDQVSLTYMDETVIDYSDGLMGSGFLFSNPTSTGSCGCGKSFSA